MIGTLAFTVPGTPALVDPASSKPLSPDLEWAMNVYSLHARGSEEQMAYLSVPGDPWSKSRPRFTRRGRTYQPRDDSEAEAALAWRMKTCKADPFSGNVMLACRFYRSNFQRVDADNLLKHVCDSANGVLWKDDSQVTFISGELLYDAHEPRTLIVAGNHTSSLVRGVDAELVCPQCGRSFMPASRGPTKSRQRFCSQACQHAARRTGLRPRRCKQCKKMFRPVSQYRRLCSPECRQDSLRDRRKRQAKPFSKCSDCGKELSHRRGGRCRECWRANPRFYDEPGEVRQ